jgi:hypothetical protein
MSKDCNFCQLAAIHLFLETGAIMTDAAKVRCAYLDAFSRGKKESPALDLLLHREGARSDEISFADALQVQSREYDSVEALLHREGVLS